MLDKYKYTDKELKTLIDSMVVLVDSREKEGRNNHILNWFDKKGIKYKKKALDYGDYSFYIPANEEFGIPKDLWFDHEVIIERKADLEEISNNLSTDRSRLEKELSLAPKNKVLLIENANFSDIIDGNYDTKYNKKAFIGSLLSFWHRYDCPVFFMPDKEYTAIFIRLYFEYYIKNYLH